MSKEVVDSVHYDAGVCDIKVEVKTIKMSFVVAIAIEDLNRKARASRSYGVRGVGKSIFNEQDHADAYMLASHGAIAARGNR